MCQFNLIILDKKFKSEDLKGLFIKNGFGFQELENNWLENQLGQTWRLVLTTKGYCDCGSIIGSNHRNSFVSLDIEKEKKKLQKKRWSKLFYITNLQDQLMKKK